MAEGKARILDAAEELMAERGAFAVSLREINTAAGQRNASGLQYHFGGREGLIWAVVERHMMVVDARRSELCDALEAEGREGDVHALCEALVVPLAERLATPSGRRYLRILPEVASRLGVAQGEAIAGNANPSLRRVGQHLAALVHELPARIQAERAAQVQGFLLHALAHEARRIDAGRDPTGAALATANLVDVLAAVVTAPVSSATARLARG